MPPDPQELLQQLETRIGGAEDPLEALAGLLGAGGRARGRLFDLAGSTLAGCRLQRILGAGGMGVTYAGEAADGALVAVKLVADLQTSTRDRFEQECRLLQSFDHPHIVRYRHHEFLADGAGALVMDRIQGIDLEQLFAMLASEDPRATEQPAVLALLQDVETRGSLWQSPRYRRRMLRLLADVAEGLHAAHERGVVHRDAKPANILVRDDLSPVVIDFGLARDAQNRVSFTRSGAALGTLCYMAPEQLGRDSGAVDRRTDVYALGLLLFRATTGTDLRSDVKEVLHSGSRSFLLDARQSRMLPVDVQAILYRCLDPRPTHRYPTAQLLAQDLRAAAGQGLVAASRPPLWVRWLRDRRMVSAAALLLISVSTLLAYWQWPRGRMVLFAANCAAADVQLRVDGARTAWLGDPIWLPFGTHQVVFQGSRMRGVHASFVVEPGDGQQWVPIVTFEEDRVRGDLDAVGRTPVQFMTGHQWDARSPGLARDRRFVDGVELVRPEPVDQSQLLPGRHELRAIDGLGRTETQVVDVGDSPLDIQLLPAVLADVGGSYRCTWSTVLSPRPGDLQLTGDAVPWLGGWMAPLFGYGLQQAPCALVPSSPDQTAHVQLRCAFPEPMRSAVVALSGMCQPAAELEVQAGFEGEPAQAWPMDESGALAPRLAFASTRGCRALVITARMRSGAAPTSSLALVRLLDGRLFGGHWRDVPPCFAIAADPGDAARIQPIDSPTALASMPKFAELRRLPLPGADPRSQVVMACAMPGTDGAMDLWLGMGSSDFSFRQFERRKWPDLALVSTLPPEALHPRTRWSDGRNFGQCLSTVPDVDGDGWSELALSDRSSELRGPVYSGSAALLRSRDLSVAWRWPNTGTTSKFGDDNACCVGVCGDWNRDGYPDLLMNIVNAKSAGGLQEAGCVEVLDGRSGKVLWHFDSHEARSYLEVRVTTPLASSDTPWPIAMCTKLRMADRDEVESCRYSVWVGGDSGHEVSGPRMPSPSVVVLVSPAAGTRDLALLVYRFGVWQDHFVGIERYEVRGAEMRLTHRVALDHAQPGMNPPLQNIETASTQVDDLDGDGWLDAAFLLLQSEAEAGCLFVSGRDASVLGYVSGVHLRPKSLNRMLWLPASGGQPAQLLLSNLECARGETGPVLGSIIPPRPIRR